MTKFPLPYVLSLLFKEQVGDPNRELNELDVLLTQFEPSCASDGKREKIREEYLLFPIQNQKLTKPELRLLC